jgi:regulatory protein
MDRIASLRQAGRGTQLVEVGLDSGEAVRIHQRRLTSAWLAPGEPVDGEQLDELRRWAVADAAERRALRLVAVRGRSRAELESRLAAWGVDAPAAAEILSRLTELGAVDDAALAAAVADQRRRTGHGRLRVQADLCRLGIERSSAAAAVEDGGDEAEELTRCRAELERRFGGRPRTRREQARAAAHLARRGFERDMIAEALGYDLDE